jgi:hypothetical protein
MGIRQPYARVELNPKPESTLSPSQGLRIWLPKAFFTKAMTNNTDILCIEELFCILENYQRAETSYEYY